MVAELLEERSRRALGLGARDYTGPLGTPGTRAPRGAPGLIQPAVAVRRPFASLARSMG